MLWTDHIFVHSSDLTEIDSEIPVVASDEGITLDGCNGFIRRQIDEAGEEVLRRMEVYGGWIGSSTLSANHIQAVLNIGGGAAASRTKILLDQIVVSDRIPNKWSYLKRWVAYRAVAGFYRNVFSRSASKDRYKSKLEEYTKYLRQVQNQALLDLGLPICYQPLPRPAAFMYYTDVGTWTPNNITLTAGSGTADATYEFAVTYLDISRYVNPSQNLASGNAESAPSDKVAVGISPGNVFQVDISTLIPPTGGQDPGTMSLCVMTPLNPTHWNLYVGIQGQQYMWLQNPSPLPIATQPTFTFTGNPAIGTPVSPFTQAYNLSNGQWADRRYQFQLLNQRA
jgi:hypothetical protein